MQLLNIGCGPCYMDGWINIDISAAHKTDICADVLALNFDGVDAILLTHMVEHLNLNEASEAFGLFYKWLKPGGILRLGVPSLELAAKAYVNGSDMRFLYGANFKGYYLHDTACERFNYFMKEWEHKITYDFQQLRLMLFDAGFSIIERKEANNSAIPNFNHDRYISESLYVEAIK